MAHRPGSQAATSQSVLRNDYRLHISRHCYYLFAARSIKALFLSAVINGVVSVPVMAMMMLITSNTKIMGKFALTGILKYVGWLATAVMALAALGMAITAQF